MLFIFTGLRRRIDGSYVEETNEVTEVINKPVGLSRQEKFKRSRINLKQNQKKNLIPTVGVRLCGTCNKVRMTVDDCLYLLTVNSFPFHNADDLY